MRGLEATDLVRQILTSAEYPPSTRLKAALAVLKGAGAGEVELNQLPKDPGVKS